MTETYEDLYPAHDEVEASAGDLDFERILLLLSVIKEAVLHGPAFTNIVAEANLELLAFNEDARDIGLERAKAKAGADAKIKADELARQNEIAAEAEAKLRDDAKAAEDAKIKTEAQVIAAGQAKAETAVKAKAEADLKAGRPVDPVVPSSATFPSDHIDSTNGRRL